MWAVRTLRDVIAKQVPRRQNRANKVTHITPVNEQDVKLCKWIANSPVKHPATTFIIWNLHEPRYPCVLHRTRLINQILSFASTARCDRTTSTLAFPRSCDIAPWERRCYIWLKRWTRVSAVVNFEALRLTQHQLTHCKYMQLDVSDHASVVPYVPRGRPCFSCDLSKIIREYPQSTFALIPRSRLPRSSRSLPLLS